MADEQSGFVRQLKFRVNAADTRRVTWTKPLETITPWFGKPRVVGVGATLLAAVMVDLFLGEVVGQASSSHWPTG